MGQVKNILIAILVFSGVVIGIGSWMGGIDTYYTSPESFDSVATFNQTAAVDEQIRNIEEKVGSAGESANPLAYVELLATGIFTVLTLFLSIPNILFGIATDVGGLLMLPDWFIYGVIFGSISITILFAIIKTVSKVDT